MNNESDKIITILIPSYNHEVYIQELFNAIDSLDHRQIKVIIIDDCSIDNTKKLIADYAEGKEYVSYMVKDRNQGIVDSLITGIDLIDTPYFYIIASDDLINVDGFNFAVDFVLDNPSYLFYIFGGDNFNGANDIGPIYSKKHGVFFSLPHNEIAEQIFYAHPAPILLQSTIFKTEEFKTRDLLSKDIRFDDYQIFLRYFYSLRDNVTRQFSFVPEIKIVKYRHHQTNTYRDYFKMYVMFEELYNKLSPNMKVCNYSKAMYWYLYFLKSIASFDFKRAILMLSKFNVRYLKYCIKFLSSKVI